MRPLVRLKTPFVVRESSRICVWRSAAIVLDALGACRVTVAEREGERVRCR